MYRHRMETVQHQVRGMGTIAHMAWAVNIILSDSDKTASLSNHNICGSDVIMRSSIPVHAQ